MRIVGTLHGESKLGRATLEAAPDWDMDSLMWARLM